MNKEVKKEVKNEFLFNITSLIKQGFNPTQISSKLSISKQKLNYYIKQLKQKGLIKRIGYGVWEINNEQVKKSSLGWTDKPITNLHAFQINFPIISGKINDSDWEVKEKLNNWIPKYSKHKAMGGITIKNNNNKSLTVWLETRNLSNLSEVYDLSTKIRLYMGNFFKEQGVILDVLNCETKNLDIGTSDKHSESMLGKGEKFKLDLNKKSEKIFPKDNMDASAWLDGSPFKFTAETNDLEWKRAYLQMPFMIKGVAQSIPAISIFNKELERYANQISLHLEVEEAQLETQKKLHNSIRQLTRTMKGILKENAQLKLSNKHQTQINQWL